MLGTHYFNGDCVEEDYSKTIKWIKKSAKQGYDEAQYQLGVCYFHGIEVDKDEERGLDWIRKAAEQNLLDAVVFLSLYSSEEEKAECRKKIFEIDPNFDLFSAQSSLMYPIDFEKSCSNVIQTTI